VNPIDTKPGLLDISWRMFGTQVRVKIWFWLFMAFFGYMMGALQLGWQFLLLWTICGFVSVMVHEIGHIVAGRCFGFPGAIILTSFGGGAVGEYQKAERWQRIIIAAAGPGAGFLFYVLIYLVTQPIMSRLAFMGEWEELVFWGLPYLAFMNLFWNILNLPPILPMDGGMIVKDLVGYVVGRHDAFVGAAISVVTAGGIVAYSLYKWKHPEAPYLGGVFQQLYPPALRINRFVTFDPDPLFSAIIYGLLGLMNVRALFSRAPAHETEAPMPESYARR
jgi:stage IV sporulation protein FB